jgi:hypothetical protein
LKLTVLLPWLDPKLLPLVVTAVPTAPELADKLMMLGLAVVGAIIKIAPSPALSVTLVTPEPVAPSALRGSYVPPNAIGCEGVSSSDSRLTPLLHGRNSTIAFVKSRRQTSGHFDAGEHAEFACPEM